MKLSEAMATGRVLLKPRGGIFIDHRLSGDEGCALGMAFMACGVEPMHGADYTMRDCCATWPWTKDLVSQIPCRCHSVPVTYATTVAHLFDWHVDKPVMQGVEPWTLDKLIDFVRSVEPADLPKPAPAPPEQHAATLETVPGPI